MNNAIPDIKTREKSVSRLKKACLMLDALNMTLDKAIAFDQYGDWTCLQTP